MSNQRKQHIKNISYILLTSISLLSQTQASLPGDEDPSQNLNSKKRTEVVKSEHYHSQNLNITSMENVQDTEDSDYYTCSETDVDDTVNILSLDGGGVRGISTLVMLSVLEMKTGLKTYEMFDHVYGTSTGGLIALMIAQGKSATEILDIYLDNIDKIFTRTWKDIVKNPLGLRGAKFNPQGLEDIIDKYVGNIKLKDSLIPVTVTTVQEDERQVRLLSSEDSNTRELSIKEAARATSAAPTYFPGQRIKLGDGCEFIARDGGIIVNNPAWLAYIDTQARLEENVKVNLLSLGTGFDEALKLHVNAGKLGFGHPANIAKYFTDLNLPLVDAQFSYVKKSVQYNRFDFRLSKPIDLADTSTLTKDKLMQLAWKRAHKNDYTKFISSFRKM